MFPHSAPSFADFFTYCLLVWMFIGACLPSGAYAFLRIGRGCSHIQGLKLSVRAHAQWPKLLNSRRGRGSLYTQSGGKGKESTYKLQALVSYQYTHAAAYKGSVKFAGNVERCCTTIQERRIDKGVFLFFFYVPVRYCLLGMNRSRYLVLVGRRLFASPRSIVTPSSGSTRKRCSM